MYLLDTCAMLGYFEGNQKYVKIIENNKFYVTIFQLMELYYISLREAGGELAEKYYETFARYKIPVYEKTLKNAMKRRLEMKGKRLDVSYVDALGYQTALENSLKFVTCDSAFEKLESVAYIPE